MSDSGSITWPGCQRQYRVTAEMAGKKFKCKCGTTIRIPQAQVAAEKDWNPFDDLPDGGSADSPPVPEPAPAPAPKTKTTPAPPKAAPKPSASAPPPKLPRPVTSEAASEYDLVEPDEPEPQPPAPPPVKLPPPSARQPAPSPGASRTCPSCGANVGAAAVICVACGTNLKTGKAMGAGLGAAAAPATPPIKVSAGLTSADVEQHDTSYEVDTDALPPDEPEVLDDLFEPVAGMTAATLKKVSIGITMVFIGMMLQVGAIALDFVQNWLPAITDMHRHVISIVGAVSSLIGPFFCLATPKETGARGFIIGSVTCQLASLAALGLGMVFVANSVSASTNAIKQKPKLAATSIEANPAPPPSPNPSMQDFDEEDEDFVIDHAAMDAATKKAAQGALLMLLGGLLSLIATLVFVYFLKAFAKHLDETGVVAVADETLRAAYITAGCFAALFVPIIGCFAILALIGATIYFAVQYGQLLYAMTKVVQAYAQDAVKAEAKLKA